MSIHSMGVHRQGQWGFAATWAVCAFVMLCADDIILLPATVDDFYKHPSIKNSPESDWGHLLTLTLTSDDLESHIVENVLSTLTNTTIWFVAALCFIVDVRTYGHMDEDFQVARGTKCKTEHVRWEKVLETSISCGLIQILNGVYVTLHVYPELCWKISICSLLNPLKFTAYTDVFFLLNFSFTLYINKCTFIITFFSCHMYKIIR